MYTIAEYTGSLNRFHEHSYGFHCVSGRFIYKIDFFFRTYKRATVMKHFP